MKPEDQQAVALVRKMVQAHVQVMKHVDKLSNEQLSLVKLSVEMHLSLLGQMTRAAGSLPDHWLTWIQRVKDDHEKIVALCNQRGITPTVLVQRPIGPTLAS